VFVLYDIALVIFRRDLRAEDHTALLRAAASSKFVLPCFIVDERQLGNENAYRSVFGQQFLVESLLELQNDIRARGGTLLVCNGKPEEIVAELSAQALSRIVGKDGNKHLGKSYQYIENYAKEVKLSPHSAVLHVLSDVEKVLHLILNNTVGKEEVL
jgi:deoxyribodipyrimidine photolyase